MTSQTELAEVMAYHGFDEATARRFLSRGDALIYVPLSVRVVFTETADTYHYSELGVWDTALCGVRYASQAGATHFLPGIGAIDAAYVCAGCLEAAGKGL